MVDLQALVGLVRILQVPGMVFSFYFYLSPLYFSSLVNDKQILLQVTLILKIEKKGEKNGSILKKCGCKYYLFFHTSTILLLLLGLACNTVVPYDTKSGKKMNASKAVGVF